MIVRHVELDAYDHSWPMTRSTGAHHAIGEGDEGQVFGQPGARIRVRLKRHPIGFAIPSGRP